MRRRIARILPPRGPACAPCEPRGRVWRHPAMASQRNRTAADVARPPARRLRRTWARWMRRQIARILPPPTPACAPGEPRGRVWRGPAVASAARCRSPRPGALPCPTHPLSCAERPACLWAQPRRQEPGAAARRPRRGPQVLRSGLAARAAWLLDAAAAAGRQLRMAAARRRSRGCAAVAPRARPRAVRRAAAHTEQPPPDGAAPCAKRRKCGSWNTLIAFYDRVVKLDSWAPIYLSYCDAESNSSKMRPKNSFPTLS